MARYERDYGPARGGYDAGFGRRTGGGYYGQGPGSGRGDGGYDRGYEGGGWGMGGLFNTIVGRGAERGGGYDRGFRAGAGYDRDFPRRGYGRDYGPSPFAGESRGGWNRFGNGSGGPERGESRRGFGGQGRGYDRSPGSARVNRSRYDQGWS